MAKKKATLPSWAELEAMHKQGANPLDTSESGDKANFSEFEVLIPNDVQTEMTTAPTSNPKRPRALTIGYNPNDRKLIVVFRDNTWWEYRNVPVEMWLNLKNSKSTGTYLASSGLDSWGDMGPANQEALSESTKVRLSQSSLMASKIQGSMVTLNEYLFGRK